MYFDLECGRPESLFSWFQYEVTLTNAKASPGFPLCSRYATINEAILGEGVLRLFEVFSARLLQLQFIGSDPAASDLVRSGATDPVKVIVKGELHTLKKIQEGRVRLIMVESLIDQMIERFLFGAQNRMEVDFHRDLPSKPGMGLHDSGLDDLEDHLSSLVYPTSSDAKAYDWSVQEWMLLADLRRRQHLGGIDPASELGLAMRGRMLCLSRSLFLTGDGVVWEQTIPGVMKSGSLLTATTNSWIRAFLCHLVHLGEGIDGKALCMTMGDDAVESNPRRLDLGAAYARFGMEIVEVGATEFCSTEFHPRRRYPQGWAKVVATYLHSPPRPGLEDVELYETLKYNLRYLPELPRVLDVVDAVGRRPC